MTKLKLLVGQWLANVTRKLQNNFYLYLAGLLTLFVLLDAGLFHVGENMRQKAFDFMVKSRIVVPNADPAIVIVDINEASLEAMAKENGRWPWPRQVFGEFLENIEAQHPRAVVFDVLFSDADVYNPDSDAYFNDVIAGTNNTFFPLLRLDPSQDKLSSIKPSMIPGLEQLPSTDSEADKNATIAVVLPHFEAAISSKRLGTHNIEPDKDGIVREYRLWTNESGWRLPAIPFVVGKFAANNIANAASKEPPQQMLINWRGKPFTYHYVSFSDVMNDMSSKEKHRPQDEFKDKIVIIGSTATSLGDIKPTAMDKSFPGVEIMANAIDNVKHGDYLHVWRGATPYVLLSLLLIWSTTLAFYSNVDRDKFNKFFSSSQIGLLVLSYIGINLTNTYLDFTGPITWAVGYFSIAKIYALATDRALQRWLAFGAKADAAGTTATLMPIIIEYAEPLGDALLKKLKRQIDLCSNTPNSVEILKGTQSGIWGLFGDVIVVSWVYSERQPDYAASVQADANHIQQNVSRLLTDIGLPSDTPWRAALHTQPLDAATGLANQWRSLFAQAILKLEHPSLQNQET